jgi:S1-C subfamily serine protease
VELTPLPTYAVEHQGSVTVLLGAVAVAVSNGSLVITTAGAVDTGDVISLRLPDGGIEQARVLLVDQRTGLALLAHDTPSVASFTVASAVQPGDVLRFYGADQVTAVVRADGSVDTSALDAKGSLVGLPEGTPVVNQRGELVALCTQSANGPLLVSLAGLDELRRVLAAGAVDKVWVGVMLGSDPTAGVVVDTLDPGGPAADAGVQAGDRILSVDGVAVADATTLGGVLAAHSPGDTVTMVVARHGDQQISIAVVLGSPRSSL